MLYLNNINLDLRKIDILIGKYIYKICNSNYISGQEAKKIKTFFILRIESIETESFYCMPIDTTYMFELEAYLEILENISASFNFNADIKDFEFQKN